MKKCLVVVTLMVYLALLVNCALSSQSVSEITDTLPDNTATFRPTVVASQPSPTLQPSPTTQATLTPTPQLENVVSVSPTNRSTIEPGIPTVVDQLYFDVPIVDALADPTTNRLYLIDAQGKLRVLGLAGRQEITGFETGFQATYDRVYAGRLLSVDPNRHRLYSGGSFCSSLNFSVFDVSDSPQYISTIGGDAIALDPIRRRAFTSDHAREGPFIKRFEVQGQTISQTMSLFGAGGWRQMFYDQAHTA